MSAGEPGQEVEVKGDEQIKADKGSKGSNRGAKGLLEEVKDIGGELYGEQGKRFYEDLALSIAGSRLPKLDGVIKPMIHILVVKPKGQLGTTMIRQFINLFLDSQVWGVAVAGSTSWEREAGSVATDNEEAVFVEPLIATCDVFFIPELRSYLMGNSERIDWLHGILSEGEGRRSLVKFGNISRDRWEEIEENYPNIKIEFTSEHSQTPIIVYPVRAAVWAVVSEEELEKLKLKWNCGDAFFDRWIRVMWRYTREEYVEQAERPSNPSDSEAVSRIKNAFTKLHGVELAQASRIPREKRGLYAREIAKEVLGECPSFRLLTIAEQTPIELAFLRTLNSQTDPTEEEYAYPLQKIPFWSRSSEKPISQCKKVFLSTLAERGCFSEDASNLTIDDYLKAVARKIGRSYDAARYHYLNYKKDGLIGSKQVERHGSKVWLTETGKKLMEKYCPSVSTLSTLRTLDTLNKMQQEDNKVGKN